MSEDSEYNISDFSKIRVQLDEVLVEQISKLIEIDLTAAALSFNIATITCLLILVEREREIQNPHGNAPPPRYSMESFLEDLEELGLDVDDDMLAALQSLAQCGYVEKDANDRFFANISAFTLVAFLDNLFPGMKGLNLVGYIVQTITEVVTGRRKLEDARMYLQQTLFSQGVALSKQTFAHSQKENLRRQVSQQNINPMLAEDMQKAYRERLETLKALKGDVSNKPSFISRYGAGGSDQIKIREVFPRQKQQSPENTTEKAPAAVSKSSVVETEARVEKEEIIVTPEKEPEKPVVPEITEESADITAEEPEIKEEPKVEDQPEPEPTPVIEPEIIPEPVKPPEKPAPAEEKKIERVVDLPEPEEEEETDDDLSDSGEIDDDEIERRIAAFSDELSLTCPVCENGKVKAAETEKGRTYFKCSNAVCNFVSWSKPYNFPCPLCSNKFLVEFKSAEGTIGLKCPRATCSFTHNSVLNPAAGSPTVDEPKKKKKLVRRIKKK